MFGISSATDAIATGNQRLWLRVLDVGGMPELADDPRFSTTTDRAANQVVLRELLERRFTDVGASDWLAATVGRDCAREMLERLQTVDAVRAAAIGLLRRIAPIDDWPGVLSEAAGAAQALDARGRTLLYQTLDDADHDADLAALVRSAAAPGLKERMRRYRKSQTAGAGAV